jgi:hypothetical protein
LRPNGGLPKLGGDDGDVDGDGLAGRGVTGVVSQSGRGGGGAIGAGLGAGIGVGTGLGGAIGTGLGAALGAGFLALAFFLAAFFIPFFLRAGAARFAFLNFFLDFLLDFLAFDFGFLAMITSRSFQLMPSTQNKTTREPRPHTAASSP